jgi:hypothetical protein
MASCSCSASLSFSVSIFRKSCASSGELSRAIRSEVAARGLVQSQVGTKRANSAMALREVDDRIAPQRNRAVACYSARYHPDRVGDLLCCRDGCKTNLTGGRSTPPPSARQYSASISGQCLLDHKCYPVGTARPPRWPRP